MWQISASKKQVSLGGIPVTAHYASVIGIPLVHCRVITSQISGSKQQVSRQSVTARQARQARLLCCPGISWEGLSGPTTNRFPTGRLA